MSNLEIEDEAMILQLAQLEEVKQRQERQRKLQQEKDHQENLQRQQEILAEALELEHHQQEEHQKEMQISEEKHNEIVKELEDQLVQLQQQLQKSENDKTHLNNELEKQKEALVRKLQSQHQKHQADKEQLQLQSVENANRIQELEAQCAHLDSLKEKNMQLQNSIKEHSQRIHELELLEQELHANREQMQKLQEENQMLEDEKSNLGTQIENNADSSFIVNLQQKVAHVEHELEDKSEHVNHLEHEIKDLLQQLDEFDRQAENNQNVQKSRSLISSILRRKSIKEELSGEPEQFDVDAALGSLKTRASALMKVQENHEQVMNDKDQELESMRQQLDEERKSYEDKFMDAMNEQIDGDAESRSTLSKLLHKSADQKRIHVADINNKLKEEHKLVVDLQKQLEEANHHIMDFRNQKELTEQDNEKLEEQMAAIQTKYDENKIKLVVLAKAAKAALLNADRVRRSDDGKIQFFQDIKQRYANSKMSAEEIADKLNEATERNGADIQMLVMQYETAEVLVEQLQKEKDEIQSKLNEVEEHDAEVYNLKEELKQVHEELANERSHIDDLTLERNLAVAALQDIQQVKPDAVQFDDDGKFLSIEISEFISE